MNEALEKINSQIQFALSYIIRDEMPGDIFSVTEVVTSTDLERSKVFISTVDNSDHFVSLLNKQSKLLRHKLAHSINIRKTPELQFISDKSGLYYDHINKIIPKG